MLVTSFDESSFFSFFSSSPVTWSGKLLLWRGRQWARWYCCRHRTARADASIVAKKSTADGANVQKPTGQL